MNIQSPSDPTAPPQAADASGPDAHYRTPDQVCGACEYFQEGQTPSGTCSKGVNGGQVEEEGGCDLFEKVEGGDQSKAGDADDVQAPGPPPESPQ